MQMTAILFQVTIRLAIIIQILILALTFHHLYGRGNLSLCVLDGKDKGSPCLREKVNASDVKI